MDNRRNIGRSEYHFAGRPWTCLLDLCEKIRWRLHGKKGENLATHEDIEKLVDQVKAVTAATKEIEEKLSNQSWDRQKRWEMRREVLFEAARATAVAKDALTKLHGVYTTEKQAIAQGQSGRRERKSTAYAEINAASDKLDEAGTLVSITCGPEMIFAMNGFGRFVRSMAVAIAEGYPERFLEKKREMVEKITEVTKAIRSEIGLSEFLTPTSQSS